MTEYTYISFATEGKYEIHAKEWKENMLRLGLKHRIRIVKDLTPVPGETFTAHKKAVGRKIRVKYIQRMLEDLQSPIIWMDCDDKFSGAPVLPEGEFDFGYVRNKIHAVKERLPIIAGILTFHPTENAKHFLRIWNYLCEWDALEPMGSNHLRLIHTLNICRDQKFVARRHFKDKDLSHCFLPHWEFGGNKS